MAEPIGRSAVNGRFQRITASWYFSTLTRLDIRSKLLAHIRTGTSGAERQEAFQQTWNFNFKALER